MNSEDIKKTSLFKLGWPIFVILLLSMLLGYIDTIMISKYSETAVGGLGNANQILSFLTLAFSIISSATGIMVAQYIGANKKEELSKIYTISIFFNLSLSLFVSAIVFFGCNPILTLMNVPDSMFQDAYDYMRIVGGFLFLQAILNVFSQIFISNGKTKYGMFISIGMNLVNIVGNYTFLYGPLKSLELGVKGVAFSTTTSCFLAVIAASIIFHKKIDGHISIQYLNPFPTTILKRLLKIGIPTAGENVSYNIAQLIILFFVNSFNSEVISNTKSFAGILSSFGYLYSLAAATATSIVVGQTVGAKEYDFAYERVLSTLKKSLLISLSIAAVSFLLSPITYSFFTNNPDIIALGQKIMFICIFLEFGRTVNLSVIQSMKAAGDVKFPTYLGMCSMWGIAVFLSYILGIVCNLGLIGIWIAMALDELFRAIIVYVRWHKGSWRNKCIVIETPIS